MIGRNQCLLCRRELEATPQRGVQRHPKADDCRVTHTDAFGVTLSDEEIKIFETLTDDQPAEESLRGMFDLHPPVEFVLGQLFDSHGLPRLGGASTGKGWSSYATAQRCLYLWHKRYIERESPLILGEDQHRAVGGLVHTFLALHYANAMQTYSEITPESCRDYLLERAKPTFVNEGWRLFEAYRLYYKFDEIEPLAVEYDLRDPRSGDSCRYDLIAFLPKAKAGNLPGTYIFEHKSSGRFDYDTLESWANDGEVIGEFALWKHLGLDKRFGPLRGVIVNLIGKQKEPKFHRTIISPSPQLVASHLNDLKRWDALIALCRSTGFKPRSRANCVNRFGRCDWWEDCVSGGD